MAKPVKTLEVPAAIREEVAAIQPSLSIDSQGLITETETLLSERLAANQLDTETVDRVLTFFQTYRPALIAAAGNVSVPYFQANPDATSVRGHFNVGGGNTYDIQLAPKSEVQVQTVLTTAGQTSVQDEAFTYIADLYQGLNT